VYVFDVAPMFLALVIFNVYHPGKVLIGTAGEREKVTREEKRAIKEAKKRAKMEKKGETLVSGNLMELGEREGEIEA
jgi:hypothetical protein